MTASDFIENADNTPRIFEDDDKEGVDGFVTEFETEANYLDLDSDNDGILDLFESEFQILLLTRLMPTTTVY
jgi:hypothetical protein